MGGGEETFTDLFACLGCALNFDGNPYNELSVLIMTVLDEYNPGELPASIRLHEAYYTVVFRTGEFL